MIDVKLSFHSIMAMRQSPADSHRLDILQKMYSWSESKKLTDFVIRLGSKEFYGHKTILSAASAWFDVQVQQGKEEVNLDEIVNNVDDQVIKMIMKYMYTGEINISFQNVMAITTASDYLHLANLKDLCQNFMQQDVDGTNCIKMRQFAVKSNTNN